MKSRIIITTLLWFSFFGLFSQQTDESGPIKIEKLGAYDLFFKVDTSEMNVVSASRSSKRIDELPITIYVVTRDEIIRNHYYSLIDVIKNLPGIRVSQPGTGELGESFNLRGLIGNLYTLILINGLPVKPTSTIGMPILNQLPIRQAEKIEIIYGPAAAVYGADAVSGVINIITREADKGTFVNGDVSIGQNEFRNTNFMIGGKAGKNKNILQYSFYGALIETSDQNIKEGYNEVYNPLHYLQEKGYKYTLGSTQYEPIEITRDLLQEYGVSTVDFMNENYCPEYDGSLNYPAMENLPSESNLLGFQLRYRDISLSYNNMYRRSHSSLGQSSYLYKYNNPQNYWGETIRSTTLSYNHEWSPRFFTTSNFSNLLYKMDNNSSMGVTFIPYTDIVYRYAASSDILFEQLFTIVPLKGLEIVTGLSYQNSALLKQTNFLDAPFDPKTYKFFKSRVEAFDSVSGSFGYNAGVHHDLSAFLQTYYSLKSFRFMGGIRVDHNSQYGISVNPRIAGLYIINPKTSFRSSVGFAYKAPPASMAWQSLAYKAGTNLDSLIYLSIPNPDLEPEKYMSVELGLIKKYRKNVNLNISIYYNSIRNLIHDKYVRLDERNLPLAVFTSDTATVLTKVNESNAISRLYGLQANIKINDLVKSINMDAEVSLTFAKSSQSFPDIFEIAGNYLTLNDFKLVPNHFGQMKISMQPAKRLYIQVSSIWESSWLRLIIPFKELYSEIIKNVDGFYSMDVVANYQIGNNLTSFINIRNLFDEKYGGPVYSGMSTPLPYNPQTGRNIQLGLTYTLN
jgi:outer membrane receptor for ferrienterochelin and colicin